MGEILAGLVILLVGWFGRQLWERIQRPHLKIISGPPRARPRRRLPGPDDWLYKFSDIVLTVENHGGRAAVDCVGWVEDFEMWRDGEWERIEPRAPAALEWEGTGGSRRATVHPISSAPPRRLRVFTCVFHDDGSHAVYPADSDRPEVYLEAEEVPFRFRATVRVHPEGGEGEAGSCRIEFEWTRQSEEDGGWAKLRVRTESIFKEAPDRWRGLLRGLLTSD